MQAGRSRVMAAHQPHFLPWLGYFDKVGRADIFVLVDHVQYEKQNFQSRNRILTPQGEQWLHVPLVQRSRDERIYEKEINHARDGRTTWNEKIVRALQCAYGRTPHYHRYRDELEAILRQRWDRLVDLNAALLRFFLDALQISTPVVRSSSLAASGAKSEMILSMCRAVGATAYLSGRGGSRSYLNESLFHDAGVQVLWQEFRHPAYPQRGPAGVFRPRMAVVDLLFNCGPDSAEVLRGRSIHEGRSDAARGDANA